jgi:hypothetical protein
MQIRRDLLRTGVWLAASVSMMRSIEAVARPDRITSATLFVAVAALGEAIIGNQLRKMIGREREAVRMLIGSLLPLVLDPPRD